MPDSKVAIVAGGSGLIGSAILTELRGRGHIAYNMDCDPLADIKPTVGSLALFMLSSYYRIDYFVNAAYPVGWQDHAALFIGATLNVAEIMQSGGGGSIVNISSIYGHTAADPTLYTNTFVNIADLGYGFTKAGIIQMSKEAAVRYAPVRVNVVCPGGVENGQDLKFVERYGLRTPLGRMAQPRDIAVPVCDILAWEYCTGQVITLDGGFTL